MLRKVMLTSAIVAIICIWAASACTEGFAQNYVAEKRSMTRVDDFVVCYGKQFKETRNKAINSMSMISCIDGKITIIPFQIDEINSEGEWVLPQIPPYLDKPIVKMEKDDDDWHFDANDELVFMTLDLGAQAAPAEWLGDASAQDHLRYEVRVVDPLNPGEQGWVYIYRSETLAPGGVD